MLSIRRYQTLFVSTPVWPQWISRGIGVLVLGALLLASPAALSAKVQLPLGPSANRILSQWLAPHQKGQPIASTPWFWTELQIHPFRADFLIGKPGEPPAAVVSLNFDSDTGSISVSESLENPAAQAAVKRFVIQLQSSIVAQQSSIRAPPKDIPDVAVGDSVPLSLGIQLERWLIPLLALGLLLGLFWGRKEWGEALRELSPGHLKALAGLLITATLALILLPDRVIYHNGHAWELVARIASLDLTHAHTGVLAPAWSYWLGWPGSSGTEAFFASRVGAVMTLGLGWLWCVLLTDKPHLSWWFVAIVLVQPVFWAVGTSAYVGMPGLALFALALCVTTLAARNAHAGTTLAAICAMGLIGSFRALGPTALPVVALMLLARHPLGQSVSSFDWKRWATMGVGALMCVPTLIRLKGLGDAYLPNAGISVLSGWDEQLLGDTYWTAPALGWIALIGGLVWLVRPPEKPKTWRPWLVVLALAAFVLGTIFITQHIAGTYLNTPRYHLWLILPAAFGFALCMESLIALPSRLKWVGVSLAVAWLIAGSLQPFSVLAEEHPETRQLSTWREALHALPANAELFVPLRRGAHHIGLPMDELRASRPDIKLVKQPTQFAFEPLACMREALVPPAGTRDDCQVLIEGKTSGWKPVIERTTSWPMPSPSHPGEWMERAANASYWTYPAIRKPPPAITLWRVGDRD